jgi:Na+-transporting methylmalonyl-CoA/oxaloacetate decarboxylase gamma subunit
MDMSTIQINLKNLMPTEALNPFGVAGMGVLVVFLGLSLISLCILILPRVLAFFDKEAALPSAGLVKGEAPSAVDSTEKERLLAIATAVYLQQTDGDQGQKITWQRHGERGSAWQASGRMQNFTAHGTTAQARRM